MNPDPKSPLFANSSNFKQIKSPAFKRFCDDELPPLSPAFQKNSKFLSKTPNKIQIKENPKYFFFQKKAFFAYFYSFL